MLPSPVSKGNLNNVPSWYSFCLLLQYKAHLIEEFTANALPLFGRSEQSQLKVVVDKVFPLASIQEAHQYVEGSKNIGKVVLEIKRDEGEVPPEADCDENVVTEEAAAHSDL